MRALIFSSSLAAAMLVASSLVRAADHVPLDACGTDLTNVSKASEGPRTTGAAAYIAEVNLLLKPEERLLQIENALKAALDREFKADRSKIQSLTMQDLNIKL